MVKVLFLPGYSRNIPVFKGHTAPVLEECASSSVIDITVINPTHIFPGYGPGSGYNLSEADTPRAWFFAKDTPDPTGRQPSKYYKGLDETWAMFKELLEKEKFDVVLGHSQGSAMAGALASRLARPDSGINHPPFKLAILSGGFAIQDNKGEFFPPEGSKSPAKTLHVLATNDFIVPTYLSDMLVDKFENPKVLWHNMGHFVPTSATWTKFFRTLFETIADESKGEDEWRNVDLPKTVKAKSGFSFFKS